MLNNQGKSVATPPMEEETDSLSEEENTSGQNNDELGAVRPEEIQQAPPQQHSSDHEDAENTSCNEESDSNHGRETPEGNQEDIDPLEEPLEEQGAVGGEPPQAEAEEQIPLVDPLNPEEALRARMSAVATRMVHSYNNPRGNFLTAFTLGASLFLSAPAARSGFGEAHELLSSEIEDPELPIEEPVLMVHGMGTDFIRLAWILHTTWLFFIFHWSKRGILTLEQNPVTAEAHMRGTYQGIVQARTMGLSLWQSFLLMGAALPRMPSIRAPFVECLRSRDGGTGRDLFPNRRAHGTIVSAIFLDLLYLLFSAMTVLSFWTSTHMERFVLNAERGNQVNQHPPQGQLDNPEVEDPEEEREPEPHQ